VYVPVLPQPIYNDIQAFPAQKIEKFWKNSNENSCYHQHELIHTKSIEMQGSHVSMLLQVKACKNY
jgi:hypothetical protein